MGVKVFGLVFVLWERIGPWVCTGVFYKGLWFLGLSINARDYTDPMELDPRDIRVDVWTSGAVGGFMQLTHLPTGRSARGPIDGGRIRAKARLLAQLTEIVERETLNHRSTET